MSNTSSYTNETFYYPQRRDTVRRQKVIPFSFPFPCANSTAYGRSFRRPTSVHRLRPGDIDVVGAMGDSLVAGNGALEEFAFGTVIEYRGVSWCAGGEGTWRQYLTLPNILKEFNPKLKGYSRGKGEFLSKNSGMNVAFPVSADADALAQAKYLVKKMKNDPTIDYQNDWKMITIFFGANDLCSSQCFNKEGTSAIKHRRKLMEALDYLYDYMPRTFVNLIPVLDVTVSVRQKRSIVCRFLHRLFCTCFHTGRDVDEYDVISQLVLDYQDAERQLVQSGRYDTKEDFTVVLQPFMTAFNSPADKSQRYKPFIDKSFITYDCFHFSQKGHALGANMLWNNLLEPVGRKSRKQLSHIMAEFRCPSYEAPYFFTNLNSDTYLRYGTQLYYEL
ncbi:hypothetical protein RUM43_001338 [Polyplax serrata]|uniref:Phospholipase B1, membrane-associated n=1 Tax=Polyplax serrata TaxID=468196 RepID=A0AAN8SE83_POLSC